jgi:hypothetical protein
MNQADFRAGQRWRVIKEGAYLWGWQPCGPGAQQGWRQTLAVGTILTCSGSSMSSGDGVPIVKWADEHGKPLAGDCEFQPAIGSMWSSAPADGYLEIVLPASVKSFDEVKAWTSYERCVAVENYGYKVDDWEAFAQNAPAALVARAEQFKRAQKVPSVIWDPHDNDDGYLLVCDGRWPRDVIELCERISGTAIDGPLRVEA